MGSGKAEKPSSKKKQKLKNLNNTTKFKKQKKQKKGSNRVDDPQVRNNNSNVNMVVAEAPTLAGAGQQLSFFVNEFQSANGVKLSSLELESIKETSFVELGEEADDDVKALGKQMKGAFGSSWKEVLCEEQLVEGKIEPGSPAILFISTSALRSIELLRGVRSLTRDCRAVKLFSKHMKVEEQLMNLGHRICADCGAREMMRKFKDIRGICSAETLICTICADCGAWEMMRNFKSVRGSCSAETLICTSVALLKNRVNLASGTPSRIKKLIDVEALGLSRLAIIVLDLHTDVKGYSLLTLPQVRDEFWDLYKNHFHQRLLQGDLRICFFGPIPDSKAFKGKNKRAPEE